MFVTVMSGRLVGDRIGCSGMVSLAARNRSCEPATPILNLDLALSLDSVQKEEVHWNPTLQRRGGGSHMLRET